MIDHFLLFLMQLLKWFLLYMCAHIYMQLSVCFWTKLTLKKLVPWGSSLPVSSQSSGHLLLPCPPCALNGVQVMLLLSFSADPLWLCQLH